MSRQQSHILLAFVALLLLVAPALGQVVATDAYQVNFFSSIPCAVPQPTVLPVVALINTGQAGTPIDANHGTICASIYVFDTNQEMQECCSCPVTANALFSQSVCDLANRPLTGQPFIVAGVIKLVADQVPASGVCNPTSIAAPVNGGFRAWRSNLEAPLILPRDDSPFQAAPLTAQEQQFLGQACAFVLYLGSGRGRCFCAAEGQGPMGQ